MNRPSSALLRLARGEAGAVEACVDAYGPLVRVLAHRLLGGIEIEDAVHEVFIELWRSAHRFDVRKASDRGFVAMIARRRLIDRRRSADRRPRTVALSPDRDRSSDDHLRTLGRVQAGPAVAALETLSSERREWILMAVVEGYSHSEIAASTGTPLGTVKSGIRRGLAEMRSWIEQREMREVRP